MKQLSLSLIITVLFSALAFAAAPYNPLLGWHQLQQTTTDETGATSVDANSDGVIDRAESVGNLDGDATLGNGVTNATLKIKGATTLWSAIDFYSGTSTNMWGVGRNSAGNFYIDRSGAGNVITILQAAPYNVGIGTASPTQKLDVAGNVKATGICIGNDCRTAWPTETPTGHCTANAQCNADNSPIWISSSGGGSSCSSWTTFDCYVGHCRKTVYSDSCY